MRWTNGVRGRLWIGRIAGVLLLAAWASAPLAQEPSQATLPLAGLRFEGLDRYTHEDVVRLSGLVAGQPISATQLTAVAQQLADTGLFTAIRYRYTTDADGLTAEFTVSESRWTVPVVFDNFLSFSDEQLIAGVAAHVPGFDGTAVEGGAANGIIALALERVLQAHGRTGRVIAIPRVNLVRNRTLFAFAVTDSGADLRLCAITVPGATAVSERQLAGLGSAFLGNPYSRSSLQMFASGTLLRHYRERGFWAATFARPEGSLDGDCTGVTAEIAVTEGDPYRWAGARWTGVSGLAVADLDAAIDIDDGVLANVVTIDDALRRVTELYHAAGFALEQHALEPELDAATGRATFVIAVTEGPQFRMGTFRVEGLPERNVADLVDRWDLKPGDVFDLTYLRTFLIEQRSRIQLQDGPFMEPDVRLDDATATADVTLRPISRPEG